MVVKCAEYIGIVFKHYINRWIVWCSCGVKAFHNVINLCNYYLTWPRCVTSVDL